MKESKHRTPVVKKEKTPFFATLRGRLTILYVFLALVPLIVLAIVTANRTYQALVDSTNRALAMGAKASISNIEDFLDENWYSTDNAANLPEFAVLLSKRESERSGSPEEKAVKETLQTLTSKQRVLSFGSRFVGYWIIDRNGRVVESTATDNYTNQAPFLGLNNADPYSFNLVLSTGYPYISPVLVSPDGQNAYIYFAAQIKGDGDDALGVLVSQYDAYILQELIEITTDLAGAGSFGVLVDENHIRLAEGGAPHLRFTSVMPLGASDQKLLQATGRLASAPTVSLSTDLPEFEAGLNKVTTGEPYFTGRIKVDNPEIYTGAVAALEIRSWYVTFVQPQSVVLIPLWDQLVATLLITSIVAAISTLLGIVVTGRLTKPISVLIQISEKVSSGNLWAQAPESRDEIGQLARAFNAMTGELRRTLEGLEQRVAERTAELAKASEQMKTRATQLQIVAEVAHAIASVQDQTNLLRLVTGLISERFAFYHVGIFLIDKNNEYALLRAANSEGGQRMLDRAHRLKVGQIGIVGFVAASGQPRIALDVGLDKVFFDNPDLPYTRSEMAVPLKLGDRVIGVLDVQSMEQSAFDDDDISLLTTLADQVSIAIENARLFSETRSTLGELQNLHRQYLSESWSQEMKERSKHGYEYTEGMVLPLLSAEPTEPWEMVRSGEKDLMLTPATDMQGIPQMVELLAPIKVRGHVIGVLRLAAADPIEGWNDEDLNMVRSVADQIGQALENARLIEETERRAEREHLVADITAKMRATNDPQLILQTAASELRQALRAKHAHFIIQPTIPTPQDTESSGGNGHKPDETGETGAS